MHKFKCPHCKQSIEVPTELLGTRVECPHCNGGFRLPAPVTPPAPAAPAAPAQQQPAPSSVPNVKAPEVPALKKENDSKAGGAGKKKMVLKSKAGSGSGGGEGVRACPFCGEEIMRTAKKCKHCGEFLAKAGSGKKSSRRKEEPQNGATILAIVSFLIGFAFLSKSVFSYALYVPAFILAAIFGIVAIVQKRLVAGIIIIILSLVVPLAMYYGSEDVRYKDRGQSGYNSR